MRVWSGPAEMISFNGTFPAGSSPAPSGCGGDRRWKVEVPVLVQVSETWMKLVPWVLV